MVIVTFCSFVVAKLEIIGKFWFFLRISAKTRQQTPGFSWKVDLEREKKKNGQKQTFANNFIWI